MLFSGIAVERRTQPVDHRREVVLLSKRREGVLHRQFGLGVFFRAQSLIELRRGSGVACAAQALRSQSPKGFVVAPQRLDQNGLRGRVAEVRQSLEGRLPGLLGWI